MDRSFLGFKQFLSRIINGPEALKPAAQQVRRVPSKPDAAHQQGWTRLEL